MYRAFTQANTMLNLLRLLFCSAFDEYTTNQDRSVEVSQTNEDVSGLTEPPPRADSLRREGNEWENIVE